MQRFYKGLSVFLFSVSAFGPVWSAVPVTAFDAREASFIKPSEMDKAADEAEKSAEDTVVIEAPTLLLPEESAVPPEKKAEKIQEPVKETPKVVTREKAEKKPVEKQVEKPVEKKAETTVEKTPEVAPRLEQKIEEPPIVAATVAPSAPPSATVLEPEKSVPAGLAKPVEQAAIPDVSPESFGLLSDSNGGLGASMWKDTSRRMIDRLMPAIELPVSSMALNDLARRFLLTVAAVPEDREKDARPQPDLVSMRVEKLLALGKVDDAWDLSALAQTGKIDEITMRQLAEAALVKKNDRDVCSKIPALIEAYRKETRPSAEWHKSLIYCQMKSDNMKAVQLGVDLMREQNSGDQLFMDIVENNVLKAKKELPANLSPLRPIVLGVLRHIGASLPADVYGQVNAAIVPELLTTKAMDERARVDLAERAAMTGEITASQLAEVYKSITFSSEEIGKASAQKEQSARSRALLYQAAAAAKDNQTKIELIQKILAMVSDRALAGVTGKLVSGLAEDIPVTEETSFFAPQGARLFALAGKPEQAIRWLKLSRELAPRFAEVGVRIASYWPVFVLSGLEADGDYAQGMKDWLYVALMPGSAEQNRNRRDYASQVLLVLSAAGYAVPEEAWLRVTEALPVKKASVPSPLLVERLERAARDSRKGETVLLSLLLSGTDDEKIPLTAAVAIIKGLRQAGLQAEAQAFAREEVAGLTMP